MLTFVISVFVVVIIILGYASIYLSKKKKPGGRIVITAGKQVPNETSTKE